MRRIFIATILSGLLIALAFGQKYGNNSSPTDEGILTPEIIHDIQSSLIMDPATRSSMNALQTNSVRDIVKSYETRDTLDFIFSHELDIKGITDQEKSGRCWLFATFNIHRQKAAEKYNLSKFEFSENFAMFWDKLEKANLFLEYVIMNPEIDSNEREFVLLLKTPLPDGGFFSMSANCIMKYGAVPKEIMPESESSASTGRMNQMISRKLRTFAFELRDMYKGKKSLKKMRERKVEMLKEVYRLLVMHLGMPPQTFTWRFSDKDDSLRVIANITPKEFWDEAVGVNLYDYYVLGNCPTQPYGKNYRIKLGRGQIEGQDWTFLNLEMKELKEYAYKILSDSTPVEFAVDMGKQVDSKPGFMALGVWDFGSFYGMNFDFSKEIGISSRESAPNHAMALVGYDDIEGKVVKWKVENSWGKDRGDSGFFLMTDQWFDRYGYSMVVHKDYLKPEHLKMVQEAPVVLPFWDPLAIVAQVGGYTD